MKVSFDEYSLGKEKKIYVFAGSRLSYSLRKYDLEISMSAYNIFNNRFIRDYSVDDYYSKESLSRIRPAQYLLNIQYHF